MFGKVHGPYKYTDGFSRVIIVHHDEQGHTIKRMTLTYEKYLQEVQQGLHKYEEWAKSPLMINKQNKKEDYKAKSIKEYKTLTCSYCEKIFTRFCSPNISGNIFCSKSCNEKQKRKSSRQPLVIKYDKQIVVKINTKKHNPHYVIYEKIPGNKETLFIPANKCYLVLSENADRKTVFRLQYKREDAVRIRPVPGYKKLFWVTETGELISKRTKNILSQTLSKAGYKVHCTRFVGRKGEIKLFRIHRCVGEAFIPNPENKPFINHIDANKINNNCSNLEWCTPKENTQHAIQLGLIKTSSGEESTSATLTNAQAKTIREIYACGDISIREIARLLDISYSVVRAITARKTYKKC